MSHEERTSPQTTHMDTTAPSLEAMDVRNRGDSSGPVNGRTIIEIRQCHNKIISPDTCKFSGSSGRWNVRRLAGALLGDEIIDDVCQNRMKVLHDETDDTDLPLAA